MKRFVTWMAAAVLLGGAGWLCPLFHIVALPQSARLQAQAEFDATNCAAAFWREKLPPALGRAAKAEEVLALLRSEPQKARSQFGRKLGVSNSTLFFLRGSGRVVAVKKTSVLLALTGGDDTADISLPTGLLFGNAVRDGTGLVDASAFPNSQNFNDLSTELNRIVETTLLPQLRQRATIGARISFAGCSEVEDEQGEVRPLRIIPVSLRFEPAP